MRLVRVNLSSCTLKACVLLGPPHFLRRTSALPRHRGTGAPFVNVCAGPFAPLYHGNSMTTRVLRTHTQERMHHEACHTPHVASSSTVPQRAAAVSLQPPNRIYGTVIAHQKPTAASAPSAESTLPGGTAKSTLSSPRVRTLGGRFSALSHLLMDAPPPTLHGE